MRTWEDRDRDVIRDRDKKPFFEAKLKMIRPCVLSQSQPHDVVEASGLGRMKAGVGKDAEDADAKRVTAWVGLGGRAENRGNLGKAM